MGALTIDSKKYGRVLARVLPRVIATDEEHERLLGEVESLMDKGEHRTAEENAALELMVRLIQDYDERHHPLPDPDPRQMLVYLMERRGLKQADLIPIFKSRGYVSEVVSGRRAISKARAKELAEFFKVSPGVFI
ncbi:MAG: helix-turn-helix domain-containing protein [Bryobacteraceae bacterium]